MLPSCCYNLEMEKLEWSALEYEDRERSPDWFWALGIIVITGTIAAVIFRDYFFAVLLILSGFLLGFFATKKPEDVFYELNDAGLKIRNRLYTYESMRSFWVQVGAKPTLFINSGRVFMPILTIPIHEEMAESIHSVLMSKNVPEQEMQEHPTEKIMEVLGF